MLTTAFLNAALAWNKVFAQWASLHTDYPGETGDHEVTGGSPEYVRQLLAYGDPSSAVVVADPAAVFDVPATTVAWVGCWDSADYYGTFAGCAPVGGNPKRYQVDLVADTIICNDHGYSNGDTVVFWGRGSVPTGLTAGVIYYVVNATTQTFKVSDTLGGSAIDLTAAPTGSTYVSKIAPVTYPSQGTHTLHTAALSLSV